MKTIAAFFAAFFAAFVALLAMPVHAAPVAIGEVEGAKITLTDEPCQLKAVVSNLPYKVTREEKGQKYEGCYGMNQMGLVMAYFSGDKTVAVMPVQLFRPVRGV